MAKTRNEMFISHDDLSNATYYWMDGTKLACDGVYGVQDKPFIDGYVASSSTAPLVFENRRALKRFLAMKYSDNAYKRSVLENAAAAPWEPTILVVSHLLSQHCGIDVESTSSAQGMALAVMGLKDLSAKESLEELLGWILQSPTCITFTDYDRRFSIPSPDDRTLDNEIFASIGMIVKRKWMDRMLRGQISSVGHSYNLRTTEDNITDWDLVRQIHPVSRLEVAKEGSSAILEHAGIGIYHVLNQPRSLVVSSTMLFVNNDDNSIKRSVVTNKRLDANEVVEVRVHDPLGVKQGGLVIVAPIPFHMFTKKRNNDNDNLETIQPSPKVRLLLASRKQSRANGEG
jgi:hypothetical protein